jgi:hypothetical protein
MGKSRSCPQTTSSSFRELRFFKETTNVCIYHEAVRLPGVKPQEALALAVLPGFEKGHPFLRWYYENPGSSSAWQVQVLDQVALAAIEGTLLSDLLSFPEDQGKGPEALEKLRYWLSRPLKSNQVRTGKSPKHICHEAMSQGGITRELAVAIGALPGYEIRKTCLNWYAENPGSAPEWQIQVLDNLARVTCRPDGLSDEVLKHPVGRIGGALVVELIRERLNLGTNGAASTTKKRSCCDE